MTEPIDLSTLDLEQGLAELAAAGSEDKPIGTAKAGYSGPKDGPFKCSHCMHAEDARWCDHPIVIEDLGATENGKAEIHPDGCCTYFRPKSE